MIQEKEKVQAMVANVRRLNLIRMGIYYDEWFEKNEDYKIWERNIKAGLEEIRETEGFTGIDETLENLCDLILEAEKISLLGSCVRFCRSQLDSIRLLDFEPTEEDREYFNPDTINRLHVIYLHPKMRHILTWYIEKEIYHMVKDLKKSKRLAFKEVFM